MASPQRYVSLTRAETFTLRSFQFVSAIPTTLPYPANNSSSSSSKRAIITGSAIGGSVFVVIVIALVIFLQRSDRLRMNYKKLRVFGKGRRRLLEDEDEEDWLGGGDGVGLGAATTQYRDFPASTSSATRAPGLHSRAGSASALSHLASASAPPTPMPEYPMQPMQPIPPPPSSPYLLGRPAASSGSIFHEAVWPPPAEATRAADPLVAGASRVDLERIVPDVMGAAGAAQQHARTPSQAQLLGDGSSSTGSSPTSHFAPSTYTTLSGPAAGRPPAPSHSLKRSWDRAAAQRPDDALYRLDAEPQPPAYAPPAADQGHQAGAVPAGSGSPVAEPPQTRLFIMNAEPGSPGSPDFDKGFAAAQAQGSSSGAGQAQAQGGAGGSPRWLDRTVRKE